MNLVEDPPAANVQTAVLGPDGGEASSGSAVLYIRRRSARTGYTYTAAYVVQWSRTADRPRSRLAAMKADLVRGFRVE